MSSSIFSVSGWSFPARALAGHGFHFPKQGMKMGKEAAHHGAGRRKKKSSTGRRRNRDRRRGCNKDEDSRAVEILQRNGGLEMPILLGRLQNTSRRRPLRGPDVG